MNKHDIVRAAADHIAADPARWNWMTVRSPSGPNVPACALGWIGYFAGFNNQNVGYIARDVLDTTAEEFYDDMYEIHGSRTWARDGAEAAVALRKYALRFPSRSGIPSEVLAIFDAEPATA